MQRVIAAQQAQLAAQQAQHAAEVAALREAHAAEFSAMKVQQRLQLPCTAMIKGRPSGVAHQGLLPVGLMCPLELREAKGTWPAAFKGRQASLGHVL